MRLASTSLIVCFLAPLGCGDGGPVDLGLPRSTVLAGITDAEAVTACENVDDVQITLTRRQECTVAGVVLSDDPVECEAVRDACLEMDPEPDMPLDCSDANGDDFAGCNVTVGDLEDCLNDQVPRSRSYLSDLTCANAGEDISPPIAESCVDVRSRCPQLFDD